MIAAFYVHLHFIKCVVYSPNNNTNNNGNTNNNNNNENRGQQLEQSEKSVKMKNNYAMENALEF